MKSDISLGTPTHGFRGRERSPSVVVTVAPPAPPENLGPIGSYNAVRGKTAQRDEALARPPCHADDKLAFPENAVRRAFRVPVRTDAVQIRRGPAPANAATAPSPR